jgi:OmpA family protein
MNRRVTAGVMVAGLGLVWGSGAQAEETGWYFGLSGGVTMTSQSKHDLDQDLVNEIAAGLADQGLQLTAASVASELDDSDKGWALHIGYRYNRWVAAEVGYLDLGKFVYANAMQLTVDDGPGGAAAQVFPATSDARFTVTGPYASILGMYAINDAFDVHVRGGLLFADTRVRARSVLDDFPDSFTSIEARDSSSEIFGGIGATWNINQSYSVRAEYLKFLNVGGDRTGENDYDMIDVAILFR